jgi:hypothetical protein
MASLTQTTLSAAITASQASIPVASAAHIVAPSGGYYQKIYVIDPNGMKGELMTVLAVSGTQVSVSRLDEFKGPHASGSIVLMADLDPVSGACFYTTNPVGTPAADPGLTVPYVNVVTGEQWIYSSVTGGWVPGWNNPAVGKGCTTAIASGDSAAVTPTGPLFHVTGSSGVTSFVIPVGFAGGSFMTINDGAWTTTAGNNVGSTTTQVATSTTTWTYSTSDAKFYCSHLAA